jgi:hypothetical protein
MQQADILGSTEAHPSHPSYRRWWALPGVVLLVALGVWVTGGLVTDDEQLARLLTGAWFVLVGLATLAVVWRHRWLAAPMVTGYLLVTVGLGGFLAYTSSVDQVVDETVVVADDPTPPADDPTASEKDGQPKNVLLARGSFEAQAHPTAGTASVIGTPDGSVLTLTDFATDPGPDLRVYLVPAGESGVDGGTDLGAMKGNKGDQQYELPAAAANGDLAGSRVVIWCRAFSVAFGSARLT